MDNELKKRLNEINMEDNVFVVFIILILLAYYSNQQEKVYFVTGNDKAKKNYYYMQIFIFLITVVISAYYFYQSYQEANLLRYEGYSKKKEYANLSFWASGAALVASFIFLYIAIDDKEIDAEITL